MKDQLIKLNEKSYNKNVQAVLFENCKNIVTNKKLLVPHIGTVRYFYDDVGKTLANVCKYQGQMEIRIKTI